MSFELPHQRVREECEEELQLQLKSWWRDNEQGKKNFGQWEKKEKRTSRTQRCCQETLLPKPSSVAAPDGVAWQPALSEQYQETATKS